MLSAIVLEATTQLPVGKELQTALQILQTITTAETYRLNRLCTCCAYLMEAQPSALVHKRHATTAIAIATVAEEYS